MKRREFIKQSVQLSVLAAGASTLSMFVPAPGFAQTKSRKKLIFVFLRGGADALGYFCPKDIAKLETLRKESSVIMSPANRVAVDGLPFYVHRGLKDLFLNSSGKPYGDVAALIHTGSINATRSHFEQMDLIESGSSSAKLADGFLGRAAAQLASRRNVSLGPIIPHSMRGAEPLLVQSLDALKGDLKVSSRDGKRSIQSQTPIHERLEMFKNSENCESGQALCELAQNAKGEILHLKESYEKVTNSRPWSAQKTGFSQALHLAQSIGRSEFNPGIMTIDVGGWDTHNLEGMNTPDGAFFKNISDVGANLAAVRQDLKSEWNDTVIVVMSEFGRTAVSNGSFGTDHGRGGMMIVMGGGVNRKYKDWQMPWDLANLDGADGSRALQVKTDYRQIMAEILQKHLKVSLDSVFPGYSAPTYKGIIG